MVTTALWPICAHGWRKRRTSTSCSSWPASPGGLIVLMSSKLGSVSLNRGGGWSSYRASKAALNTLARSFAGQHKGADWGVVLMHPGWVRTDLGGRRATLDVETSARGMVGVLEARLGQPGCVFLDHAGETVPW